MLRLRPAAASCIKSLASCIYIAGYTVANLWRYPIRRHVSFASALEFPLTVLLMFILTLVLISDSLDADVLRKYIKKLSPIHPSEEERITFVSESTSGASTVIIASPLFMYLVCLFVALLFLGKS